MSRSATRAHDTQSEIIVRLAKNRVLAHRILFAHRHKDEDAPFKDDMIFDWHSSEHQVLTIAFRGSTKSTTGEEALIIRALLREFSNCIIFGATAQLAQQRLHAIRREFEKNEAIKQIFGDLRSQPWADEKLELATGIVIQAMGRGQALRGTKEEILRPDFIWGDDIEDRASVRTPEAREQTLQWWVGEVMQTLDRDGRARITANDMDPECLANKLKVPGSGWRVRIIPWEFKDPETGARKATWPARFSLAFIDAKRRSFESVGRLEDYNRDYLCKSETPEEKAFRSDMFRTEVQPRSWHAVYGMFDPARTVTKTSADTGFAAWSYLGPRIIVWDAWSRALMPDEIVKAIFDFDEEVKPCLVGVEEDGLNQFLMQPIRQEQLKRGRSIPVKAMKAPTGKRDFIRGLQPFFTAHEVIFAKELPELRAQLLTFPRGRIDSVNALAYALKMRPGAPVYEEFDAKNIVPEMDVLFGKPAYLALNATPFLCAAVLCQYGDGTLRVIADWVREGEAEDVLPDLVREAQIRTQRSVEIVMAPSHFERFTNVGLYAAARRLKNELRTGTKPEMGRSQVRELLRRRIRQMPGLIVSAEARWSANALAGGYARQVLKGGVLADLAEDGVYRVLMESLESFAGLLRAGAPDKEEQEIAYDFTASGRKFISARR